MEKQFEIMALLGREKIDENTKLATISQFFPFPLGGLFFRGTAQIILTDKLH